MRCLGPAILDPTEQRALQEGRGAILIGRDRVFADAAARAQVGDLWWTKEPFFDVQSMEFGCIEIHELIPGFGPRRYDVPDYVKPWSHRCRWKPMPAAKMVRADSRFTLNILTIEPKGFRCAVTRQQVDHYMGERVRAA